MARDRAVDVAVGRLANRTRWGRVDDNDRRALAEARLARYVRETVESAPPLTAEQQDRLIAIIRRSEEDEAGS